MIGFIVSQIIYWTIYAIVCGFGIIFFGSIIIHEVIDGYRSLLGSHKQDNEKQL